MHRVAFATGGIDAADGYVVGSGLLRSEGLIDAAVGGADDFIWAEQGAGFCDGHILLTQVHAVGLTV